MPRRTLTFSPTFIPCILSARRPRLRLAMLQGLTALALALPAGARETGPDGSPAPGSPSLPAPPAAGEAAIPPALTEYKGRRIAQTMHWTGAEWLIRQDREQEENAALMLRELRIQPGWTICDLGCGNGYHALSMAGLTGPDGRILAVDIQPQMLEMLAARAGGRGIRNITPITGLPHDPRLPPESCDLILLVDVYHEFSHPEHQLKAIHAALKPGGLAALVEFRAEDSKVPIKPEHKMSRDQIRREWLPMGFEVAREFDGLPWQHLILFRKAAPAPAPKGAAPEPPPAKQ